MNEKVQHAVSQRKQKGKKKFEARLVFIKNNKFINIDLRMGIKGKRRETDYYKQTDTTKAQTYTHPGQHEPQRGWPNKKVFKA